MSTRLRKQLPRPLRLCLMIAVLMVAGAALDRMLQASLFSDTNAATAAAGEAELRITASPRSDGSLQVGLQQRGDDGVWGEVRHPDLSIVPAGAEPNRTLYSSPFTVSTSGDVYTLADAYYEHARDSAQPELDLPADARVWCLLHDAAEHDAGRALCQGLTDRFGAAAVETIRYSEIGTGLGRVVGRILGGDAPDLLAVGRVEELFGLLGASARHGGEIAYLLNFPLDTIDPQPPSGARYCLIGHGDNSFWHLLFDAAIASASHLGVELTHDALHSAAERATKIRECVADDVDAIAVTLAETEHVADAIGEARAQGVPVVTYNSGASAARAAGSMLHLGLDDRKAGEIVGAQLTADGVQGSALCLVHEARNVGLTERCQGLAETYGVVETLSVAHGFDPLSERLARGGVGAVVLLNAADVTVVAELIERAGVSPTLAVIGFDTRLVQRMLSGRVSFAVWDQGTLQGYLAVALAALADTSFLLPDLVFSGAQLLIEPSIITAEEMRAQFAAAGG